MILLVRLWPWAAPIAAGMTFNNNNNNNIIQLKSMITDAEAYHTFASAAVDLSLVGSSHQILRSTRDIDSNQRRTFVYPTRIFDNNNDDDDDDDDAFPMEESLSEHLIWRTISPSGQKMVVVRKKGNDISSKPSSSYSKQGGNIVFEFYTKQGGLVRKVHWTGQPPPQHGDLLVHDATFGTTATPWDPTESYLVYTAELLPPLTSSWFDTTTTNKNDEDDGFGTLSPTTKSHHNQKNLGMQNVVGFAKQETFGEKLHHQYPLHGMFVLDFHTGMSVPIPTPHNEESNNNNAVDVVGQPIFQNNDSIVYTCWKENGNESPRRLGLIYCQQRPTELYRINIANILNQLRTKGGSNNNNNISSNRDQANIPSHIDEDTLPKTTTAMAPRPILLTKGFRIAWSPRVLPDGRLMFLANQAGFETHAGCFGLAVMEESSDRNSKDNEDNTDSPIIRMVVDTVHDPYTAQRSRDTVAGLPFPGLFVTTQLPGSCAISNDLVLLTTQWGSCSKVIRVSLSTGKIVLLQLAQEHELSSQTMLWTDPKHGYCYVSSQAPNQPASLYRLPINRLVATETLLIDAITPKTFPPIAASSVGPAKSLLVPKDEDWLDFDIIETLVPAVGPSGAAAESTSSTTTIQSILLMPKKNDVVQGGSAKPPLIVIPHGGPHIVSSTTYQPSYAFLCAHGQYALLLVNYRGSMGFGTSFLESLPTRIGSLDVMDTMAAIESVRHRVDDSRIAVCGGSHGGFLATHLTGQFPDAFKAAALRNPVVDLPAMVSTTDIPDWCYVEGCKGKYHWDTYRPPSADELLQLYQKSPIQFMDKVKAPTLVALGLKDLRVPPSQGKEWYYSLKSNQVKVKLIVYDDDGHAIDSPASEADHWIAIKRWFDQHLLHQ